MGWERETAAQGRSFRFSPPFSRTSHFDTVVRAVAAKASLIKMTNQRPVKSSAGYARASKLHDPAALSRKKDNSSSAPTQQHPLTIADIIRDCAGKIIVRSAANPTSNYDVDETTYVQLWANLCQFLRQSMNNTRSASSLSPNQTNTPPPVNIMGIGVASHRSFNLGIKIPTFELSAKFAFKYNLVQPKSISNSRPTVATTVKLHAKELMSPGWKVNEEKIDFALQSLVACIGETLKSGRSVNIDFGIGVLVGENNICNFNFTQRPDAFRGGGSARGKHEALLSKKGLSPRAKKLSDRSDRNKIASRLNKELERLRIENDNKAAASGLSGGGSETNGQNSPENRRGGASAAWSPVHSKKDEDFKATTAATATFAPQISHDNVVDSTAPPLLDNFARLLCVTISGSDLTFSPSDKIGSYFSMKANALYLSKALGRIDWVEGVARGSASDQLVDVHAEDDVFGLKAAAAKSANNPDSPPPRMTDAAGHTPLSEKGALRYIHYLNKGAVDEKFITPFNENINARILAKFASAPSHKVSAYIKEIEGLYIHSVKKATLDYILLSKEERERLCIEEIPPDVKVSRSEQKNPENVRAHSFIFCAGTQKLTDCCAIAVPLRHIFYSRERSRASAGRKMKRPLSNRLALGKAPTRQSSSLTKKTEKS